MKKYYILFILIIILFSACYKSTDRSFNKIRKNEVTKTFDQETNKKYQNKDFKFNFTYPSDWFLHDCKGIIDYGNDPELVILMSDNEDDDCYKKGGGRINIVLASEEDLIAEREMYEENRMNNNLEFKEREVELNEEKVQQRIIKQEIMQDAGVHLPDQPLQKIIKTYIPYGEKYIAFVYNEIYEYKDGDNGKEIDKDFEPIYNDILKSFDIIEN